MCILIGTVSIVSDEAYLWIDHFYSFKHISEMRQRGRFAGFSLFVSTTGVLDNTSLCYKDGPELPSLNITINCTTLGRYVIFFNERLYGVTYPEGYESSIYVELCEVIVYGKHIFYGKINA